MCGLVGMAGDITVDLKNKVFRDMLDVCQIRGRDSTGVIKVNKGTGYQWQKDVGSPSNLYDRRSFETMMTSSLPKALIGHCRAKTVGAASVRNAHPFDFPEQGVVGVHNGTLRGYTHLTGYAFDKVDSEVLYNHLAEHGPDETFNQEIGAYACVWWDETSRTLNFIRNTERPLLFTYSKDKKQLFWASESWMFGVITRKMELWDGGETGKVFFELPVNTHWAVSIADSTVKDVPMFKLEIERKIEVEKKQTTTYFGGAWHQQSTRTGGTSTALSNVGGEVKDPFLQKAPITIGEIEKKVVKENSHNVNKSTGGQSQTYLTHYTRTSNQNLPIVGKNTTSDTTTEFSLLQKSITLFQTINKEKSLEVQRSSLKELKTNGKLKGLNLPLITQRYVAGMEFITDRLTGSEVSSDTLRKVAGDKCFCCDGNIPYAYHISAVINGAEPSKMRTLCFDCCPSSRATFQVTAIARN